jgi:serine/threonine protein kinase
VGTSIVDDGQALALKMWHEGDDASLDQLQKEASIMMDLSGDEGALPCPRLYDVVGSPLVTGLVMEWCPADLERWWRDKLNEVDGFGRLMATMAQVARRLADYHDFYAQRRGMQSAHGDLKPSNVLLSADGRWLISDFGTARVKPPDEAGWATSRVVVGTENFLAPEVLFHARKPHPAAIDTWALGATTVALLRLQRMMLDGGPVPRNGTHSPRFRMARVSQIIEVYGRDPARFRDRKLDASAFPDHLRLPEEDRRGVRESLRGVFGADDPHREGQLAEKLLEVLDRAMSIEPAHRYTDARDIAAAFDQLTRFYIELWGTMSDVEDPTEEDSAPTLRELELASELAALRQDLESARAPVVGPVDTSPPPSPRAAVPVQLPRTWGAMLSMLLMLNFATLVAVLVVLVLVVAVFIG